MLSYWMIFYLLAGIVYKKNYRVGMKNLYYYKRKIFETLIDAAMHYMPTAIIMPTTVALNYSIN